MRYETQLRVALAVLVASTLLYPLPLNGYAVLAHEAIIDSAWDSSIRPLLLKKYPHSTSDELRKAHGYAYGGAIVQDMGYYPHGSRLFSDLTHYVRSGDFVETLLQDSDNLNEYAFALGALAHYVADNIGHPMAVNKSVPLLYPQLEKKFGNVVTYEDDPLAHIKVEFGYDVLQVARGRYAPDSYRNFIGFEVAERLLDQAFCETYGMDLHSLFVHKDKVIGSYRHDVSSVIPKATRVAWHLKRDEIQRDLPGATKKTFLYNLSRASYEKEWGRDYQQPSTAEKFFAFLYRMLPKIGPLKVLTFRTPTPQTERYFEASFNATLDRYRSLLGELKDKDHISLPDTNIDVGVITPRGKYHLYDKTCAQLLNKLAANRFAEASPELRASLLRFYSEPAGEDEFKLKKKERERLESNVRQLRTVSVTAAAEAGSLDEHNQGPSATVLSKSVFYYTF